MLALSICLGLISILEAFRFR